MNRNENYRSPELEDFSILVEKGFAASLMEIDCPDCEDGGIF